MKDDAEYDYWSKEQLIHEVFRLYEEYQIDKTVLDKMTKDEIRKVIKGILEDFWIVILHFINDIIKSRYGGTK